MKKTIGTFVTAAAGAALGFGLMLQFAPQATITNKTAALPLTNAVQPLPRTIANSPDGVVPNFVEASAAATPAVVHVKAFYPQSATSDPFHGFFGNPNMNRTQPQAAGSGVIISQDGYITTNNHVIRHAERVEVMLEDKRSFKAKVIGTDPTTDLALLKIESEGLPYLSFGSSDEVQVGEWVLAVGNPFNLTSTVTAGIVSAKGRSLNLLNEEFAIESFIQTDAAVNPGNSGGALINTSGELVGINTAIASETGSFSGYSFAVPTSIVKKVMEDLREYGEVQRGIIGVQIRNITSELAEAKGLGTLDGAYVTGTIAGGAAEAAGIKSGDIITKVNGHAVKGSSELQEMIATYRPGDQVGLEVIRDGERQDMDVTLRNREGKTGLTIKESRPEVSENQVPSSNKGASMSAMASDELKALGLESGVKVLSVEGTSLEEAGIEPGFIITKINKEKVASPKDVERLIGKSRSGILVEGITKEGKHRYYAFE